MFYFKIVVNSFKVASVLTLVPVFWVLNKQAFLALLATVVGLQNADSVIVVALVCHKIHAPSGNLVRHLTMIGAPRIDYC